MHSFDTHVADTRITKRWAWSIVAMALLLGLSGPAWAAQEGSAEAAPVPGLAHSFDSHRDPATNLRSAIAEAQHTGRRILLDVGGDWCPYCQEMDAFWKDHADLLQMRDARYITVYVAYGTESPNAAFLSGYPKVLGVPHFYVLDGDGTLLQSQHVLELREGGKYSPDRMRAFLLRWSESERSANSAMAGSAH